MPQSQQNIKSFDLASSVLSELRGRQQPKLTQQREPRSPIRRPAPEPPKKLRNILLPNQTSKKPQNEEFNFFKCGKQERAQSQMRNAPSPPRPGCVLTPPPPSKKAPSPPLSCSPSVPSLQYSVGDPSSIYAR